MKLALGVLAVLTTLQVTPPAERPVPTQMAAALLAEDPLIVVGRTLKATDFGMGTAVVRVLVEEHLGGPPAAVGEELVVFAYAGDLIPGGIDLLFLLPTGHGGRWRIRERIDGRDPNFMPKRTMTARILSLAVIDDPDERDAATFDALARSLLSSDRWIRRYAAKELQWMVSGAPWVLTSERVRRLEMLAPTLGDTVVRAGVESVAIAMANRKPPLPTPEDEESSAP